MCITIAYNQQLYTYSVPVFQFYTQCNIILNCVYRARLRVCMQAALNIKAKECRYKIKKIWIQNMTWMTCIPM